MGPAMGRKVGLKLAFPRLSLSTQEKRGKEGVIVHLGRADICQVGRKRKWVGSIQGAVSCKESCQPALVWAVLK